MKRPAPPGFVAAGSQPDVTMMICTAGHVDHGKTRLVKLLTGCETDRLKEERARGLTIELGFAPCLLGGDHCVGIVDVPGHEKFVRTMVTGVSGIDLALLVIAADDGVMPQTVEHVQIMELMGLRHGIVALTKIDMVAPELVAQRQDEIREFLKGTFLAGASIFPVSSETFEGYSEFYDGLINQAQHVKRARVDGIFRMPIERVFAREGFGLILTGIPIQGSISVGDEVEVVPGGMRGRIRGMQSFLKDAASGGQGQCLALNIPDLAKQPPVRGDVLCLPGLVRPARFFHVRLTAVNDLDPPLRHAERVKLHSGTFEEQGKLYLLEDKVLPASQSALASIATTHNVCAAVGDRIILRRPSPPRTVAGGAILAITYEKTRPRRQVLLDELVEYERFFREYRADDESGFTCKVAYGLAKAGPATATLASLQRDSLLSAEMVQHIVTHLIACDEAVALESNRYVDGKIFRDSLAAATAALEAAAADGALSVETAEIRQAHGWHAALWNRLQKELVKTGIVRPAGSRLILVRADDGFSDAERSMMERVEALYEETGYKSPRPAQVPEQLQASERDVNRAMNHLINTGRLVRLSENVVLSTTHLRAAQDLVVRTLQEEGTLDSSDFKYKINSTRKYALAILDYLDARRVTVRAQNQRSLAFDYERNLLT